MPLHRRHALLAAALLLLAAAWRLASRPGLRYDPSHIVLPADGREHLAVTLSARHHLPLRASDLRITGIQPSTLRLEDLPSGRVALYLRTPVLLNPFQVAITGRGSALSLPVTLTAANADTFGDGTPDWMRLHSATDRQAFRRWFTALADQAADAPPSQLPPEITDCASLLRYAYRESLRLHDDRWYVQQTAGHPPPLASVQQWSYPNTPLGAALFRTRPGPFVPSDLAGGAFTQFADARTLLSDNAYLLSRSLRAARPGDLIFYRQFQENSQYHSMIVTGDQGEWVVYHTGPMDGHPGEMRRVLLSDLLHHPNPRWRPQPSNPNFLGVYRWNILREQ